MNSTLDDDAPVPGERHIHWRHRGQQAMPTFYLLCAADGLLPGPSWMKWTIFALLLLLMTGMIRNIVHHERDLCSLCMAKVPLDPDASVRRQLVFLRMEHQLFLRNFSPLAVMLVGSFFGTVVQEITGSIGCVLAMAYSVASQRHNVLQPWCPLCNHGGGGDERMEAPAPTGGHGRPVPVA